MPATTATGSDLDILQELNRDYIRSVQHSDVRRFERSSPTISFAAIPTDR